MNNTLGKGEKLKSKKIIEQLFSDGQRIKSFPLHMIYLKIDHRGHSPNLAGFSVPKRNIKLAVDRNRIKRMMREVYRKNKSKFINYNPESHVLMFIYTGSNEIKYEALELSLLKIASKFINK